MVTKERLIQLAERLGTRKPKRGADGHWYIFGRRGDIYADTNGYSLYAQFISSMGLNLAKAALAHFADRRHRGDMVYAQYAQRQTGQDYTPLA